METLPDQFRQALKRLELGERHARVIAAQTEIRQLLESDPLLCSWGVDTILIGSYARQTAIYPGRDVDVFTKLTKLDIDADPKAVYEAVYNVLRAEYGDRATRQRRSIKIAFSRDGEDDFSVDVVPAVRFGTRWGIPNRDSELWGALTTRNRWEETDPERLTELSTAVNALVEVDGQGAYKPVVKLVRQSRRHHLGDDKPGGFYFELMTYWAFRGGIRGDSFAELFAETLALIAAQLSSGRPVIDPVLEQPYSPAPKPEDIQHASLVFADLAAKAANALRASRCRAAVLWREILGEVDGRGPCFPLPSGCDEYGKEIRKIAPVSAVGPPEASGFA